jgi:hypothetical protein
MAVLHKKNRNEKEGREGEERGGEGMDVKIEFTFSTL